MHLNTISGDEAGRRRADIGDHLGHILWLRVVPEWAVRNRFALHLGRNPTGVRDRRMNQVGRHSLFAQLPGRREGEALERCLGRTVGNLAREAVAPARG